MARKILGKPKIDLDKAGGTTNDQFALNLGRLRQAMLDKDARRAHLLSLWLEKRGMTPPTTVEACEEELWRLTP